MFTMHQECEDYQRGKNIKVEKVIHHAVVSNLFGFGYMKKSSNAQGSSKSICSLRPFVLEIEICDANSS